MLTLAEKNVFVKNTAALFNCLQVVKCRLKNKTCNIRKYFKMSGIQITCSHVVINIYFHWQIICVELWLKHTLPETWNRNIVCTSPVSEDKPESKHCFWNNVEINLMEFLSYGACEISRGVEGSRRVEDCHVTTKESPNRGSRKLSSRGRS